MQQAAAPHQIYVESDVPDAFFPDDATVVIVARQIKPDLWESIIPQFAIAGQGNDDQAAAQNALELLADYLLLMQKDGKTFAQSLRPVSLAEWAQIYGKTASAALVARVQKRAARRQLFRFPLARPVGLVAH